MTFTTINDDVPEPFEIFSLRIVSSDEEVVTGALALAVIMITANDNAAGIFGFLVCNVVTPTL